MRKQAVCLLLVVLSFAPAFAQGRGGAQQATPPGDSTPRVETAGDKEEKISQTSHTIRLDGRDINMTEPLRSAMSHNPFLKILVNIGYYDMATVMGGTEYNFAHLGYDPTFTSRVSFTYYEAGHMIYIRPSEHKKLTSDIAKFIQGSRGASRPASTSQPQP